MGKYAVINPATGETEKEYLDISDDDLEAAIAAQPVEVLRRLARRHFSDAALRQSALDERDACYRTLGRALARALTPHRGFNATAEAIRKLMKHYRDDGPWRFQRGGPAPADPLMAVMHRALTLDPEVRSRQTIGRALSATRSKSPLSMDGTQPHGASQHRIARKRNAADHQSDHRRR